MQANVEFAPADAVKTIESAGRVVALEDADFFAEVSQTDPRSQTRHARPDDRDIVVVTGVHAWRVGREKAGKGFPA